MRLRVFVGIIKVQDERCTKSFYFYTFAQELVDSLNKHHILNIDAFKLYSFKMHFVIGSELSGHYIAPHSSLKIYQIVVFK